METIGHIIGFCALILIFISYQIHDKKKLILIQTISTTLVCIQYILIGAYSGFALNIVCIIRNIIFYNRDKKFFSSLFFPIFFACVIPLISLLSWDGYYSIFIVIGLMINTICLGICSAQNLRIASLLCCTLIIIYNVCAHSYSGIVNETVTIISSIIGIFRYVRLQNSTKAK